MKNISRIMIVSLCFYACVYSSEDERVSKEYDISLAQLEKSILEKLERKFFDTDLNIAGLRVLIDANKDRNSFLHGQVAQLAIYVPLVKALETQVQQLQSKVAILESEKNILQKKVGFLEHVKKHGSHLFGRR